MSSYNKVENYIDFSTKGITPKYVKKSNIIVLNQKCIRNNSIDYSFSRYVDENQKISDDKIIREGDILINSTGQGTAGRCAFVDKLPNGSIVVIDSHILLLRCSSIEIAKCINYSLFSYEKQLQTFLDGSTGQGELDKVKLFNLQVIIPQKLDDQKKLITCLHNLDKKIELNKKINIELESMVRTLYNYWFIQFDFPNENEKPYKSSNSKMFYNKKLKREIPYNWEDKKLNELIIISKSSVDPSSHLNEEFKYFSIPVLDKTKMYKLEKGKEIKSNKYRVTNEDILISKLNPWFSRVVYPLDDEDMICSTEFVVCKAQGEDIKNFIFWVAKSQQFKDFCTQSATGTSNSHKRVSPDIMTSFKIPYNEEIVKKFAKKVDPINKMIVKNIYDNQKLAELRDWLLPMLMNGQVTIKDNEYIEAQNQELKVAQPKPEYN